MRLLRIPVRVATARLVHSGAQCAGNPRAFFEDHPCACWRCVSHAVWRSPAHRVPVQAADLLRHATIARSNGGRGTHIAWSGVHIPCEAGLQHIRRSVSRCQTGPIAPASLRIPARRLDHRDDACPHGFRQLGPGLDNSGQIGVILRGKRQAGRQDRIRLCRKSLWLRYLRRFAQGFESPWGRS